MDQPSAKVGLADELPGAVSGVEDAEGFLDRVSKNQVSDKEENYRGLIDGLPRSKLVENLDKAG
jgi:hypothetical protein